MAPSAKRFATLLQAGITAIAKQTAKPKGVVRDELGYAIGRNGGSATEYWLYGDGRIPSRQDEVEALARVLVEAGGLDRTWLAAFLESAGYANYAQLVADLFPDATDQPSHNLPLPPTPFVGRERELAALAALITNPDCRLVTLVGAGGSGKTRLAVEAARAAHPTFADGVAFITLAPLITAEFVVATVATTLNFTLSGHATPQTQLLHYLRRKALLLVLDNFEHLLPPPVPLPTAIDENPALALVTGILQAAPAVTLLVTSRERLNLQGEWVYEVGGLEIPDADNPALTAESSALTLFLQTARRVQATFTPTPADQAAILRICQQVAGMPLALELAAAWVRVLSCREIAKEIDASLGFLTATLRNLPDRHRSMQAVFDHSWELLSAEEQRVFARCSVFRGGFTREAAAQVAGATLPILTALVDKSLLSRNRQGRYEIHELARQYAAEHLLRFHQAAQTRNRHLAFFMNFAEAAEPKLRSGRQVAQWHDRVEVEHDNLRAALAWSLAGGEFVAGMGIVGALWEFWMNRGYASEGQSQAERFLVRPEAAAPTYARAKALYTAGVCAFYQGRYPTANSWLTESIAISRALGSGGKFVLAMALIALGYTLAEPRNLAVKEALSQEILALGNELQDGWVEAHALYQLGSIDRMRGDITTAQERYRKSVEYFQSDGNSVMRGPPMMTLGVMFCEQGHYDMARGYILRSMTIFEEVDDPIRKSMALTHLGNLAMTQGNDAEAQEFLTKALTLIRKSGQLRHHIIILDALGRLVQQHGDYGQAYTLHHESITLSFELGQQDLNAIALDAFACLAARQAQAERAALLFSVAEAYLGSAEERFDLTRALRSPHWYAEHDRLLASVRDQLGEAAFATAWAMGTAMDLAQAVAYALAAQPLHQQ